MKPFNIWKNVYAVGGAELSHPSDCLVYLIGGEEMVLIDSGAGESFERIVDNIRKLGLQPERLRAVIATHAHIDHIGSLYRFREEFGVQVIAHKLETEAIETGVGTGAEFYRVNYKPCKVDMPLNRSEEVLRYGGHELKVIHIPGHTPGGIAVYLDAGKRLLLGLREIPSVGSGTRQPPCRGERLLFGQDVHGPYFLKGSNIAQAKVSLQKLVDLEADILCEGHFGIYQPAEEVRRYIEGYLYGLHD